MPCQKTVLLLVTKYVNIQLRKRFKHKSKLYPVSCIPHLWLYTWDIFNRWSLEYPTHEQSFINYTSWFQPPPIPVSSPSGGGGGGGVGMHVSMLNYKIFSHTFLLFATLFFIDLSLANGLFHSILGPCCIMGGSCWVGGPACTCTRMSQTNRIRSNDLLCTHYSP